MDNQNYIPNRPLNNAEVIKFTFITFVLATIAIAGSISAVIYHPLWFAIAGASFVASVVLYWRIREHDRRAFSMPRPIPPQITTIDSNEVIEVMKPITINKGNWSIGKWEFNADEWRRLAAILSTNDWRFTRDICQQAGLFSNITKNWREINADFERVGMVKDYELTQAGRDWFGQLLPHPNGKTA